jgi:hypothetical protein
LSKTQSILDFYDFDLIDFDQNKQKKAILKIKIFGQKLKFLAHSEGCNGLKTNFYSVFSHFGSK